MGWHPTLLAFDTSAAHCAAAVFRDNRPGQHAFEEMARGQSERLMPLLQSVLLAEGIDWRDLTAIGVGIGPGNFTGIRISVATARGLALGLGIPAFGISTFELMLDPGLEAEPSQIVSVAAPRGQAHVQHFRYGRPQSPPRLIDPEAPPRDLELPVNMKITGFRAEDIARPFGANHETCALTDLPDRLARVAAWKWSNRHDTAGRPAPLYVRPADALPAADPPPVILP